MAFVVDNGKGPNESLLPPPSDLPKCWENYQLHMNNEEGKAERELCMPKGRTMEANNKIFTE